MCFQRRPLFCLVKEWIIDGVCLFESLAQHILRTVEEAHCSVLAYSTQLGGICDFATNRPWGICQNTSSPYTCTCGLCVCASVHVHVCV